MPASWQTPVKISEAAKAGYTIAVPSFLNVNGSEPVQFFNDVFLAYTTWDHKASDPD